jgi:integrase
MKITINEIKNKMIENGLKESSANTNIANLKRIARDVFSKDVNELTINELKNYYSIFGYVASDEVNNNMKKTLLNSVLNVVKCISNFPTNIIEKYKSQFDKQAKITDEARELAPPTEREKINKITMDEIRTKRDELKLKLIDKYVPRIDIQYLILCLYSYLPPLRIQDYYNTRIDYVPKKDRNKINFIDLKTKQLIVNDYKTAKKYGKRTINLTDELNNIIIEFKKKSKAKFLIPKSYNVNEPISPTNMTHLIERILGKKASSQIIRKAYISEMLEKGIKPEQAKKVAEIMGHSLYMQRLVYNKYTTEVAGDETEANEEETE